MLPVPADRLEVHRGDGGRGSSKTSFLAAIELREAGAAVGTYDWGVVA